jgi:hypothetical protein
MSFTHEAAPHEVSVDGKTQLVPLTPLHLPAQVPVPGHGVRGVVTALHAPGVAEQDWH